MKMIPWPKHHALCPLSWAGELQRHETQGLEILILKRWQMSEIIPKFSAGIAFITGCRPVTIGPSYLHGNWVLTQSAIVLDLPAPCYTNTADPKLRCRSFISNVGRLFHTSNGGGPCWGVPTSAERYTRKCGYEICRFEWWHRPWAAVLLVALVLYDIV